MEPEIDYNAKILNFLAMTETGDQEVATKYLETSDWDETKAVNKFYNNITPSMSNTPINNNIINNINMPNDEINNINISTNRSTIGLISQDDNNNNKTIKIQKKKGFINKYFLGTIKFLLDCCSERREVTKNEEKKLFQYLPNLTDDFIYFCQSIKKKIGIIIFYTSNNLEFLHKFISQISRSTLTMNIIKNNFIIFPLLANTNEGYKIQEIVSDNELAFPAFVFCSKLNNSEQDYINTILNKYNIIKILESETITINVFHSTIIDISNKYISNNNNKKSNQNEFDNSFGPLTDAEILNQQNYEMEKLEKQVQKKEEELNKEKMDEEKRKKEEEIKIKEIEEKAEEAKKIIVDEPNKDDPDSTEICFRYPDGEKTKNRRFLKSNTIQNLYDYITSLGEEIYSETENNQFSLYQPFPPKKYDIMDNTLEKEGLFPNAVIQIRED